MTYDLKILDDARLDIANGSSWYDNKRQGLGSQFVQEVFQMLNYINQYPEHYQIRHRQKYRQAILKRFPYLVIYIIVGNDVIVYPVFPVKDDPDKRPE